MIYNDLLVKIHHHTRETKHLIEVLTGYLHDKEEPLEDRWTMFEHSYHLLPTKSWVISLAELDKHDIDYRDDIGNERYQNVDFLQLVEEIENGIEDVYEDGDKFVNVDINEVKEQILATGHAGFKYDW